MRLNDVTISVKDALDFGRKVKNENVKHTDTSTNCFPLFILINDWSWVLETGKGCYYRINCECSPLKHGRIGWFLRRRQYILFFKTSIYTTLRLVNRVNIIRNSTCATISKWGGSYFSRHRRDIIRRTTTA